jgi:hypothetical protein
MRISRLLAAVLFISLGATAPLALSADASVKITAPADGAKLDAMAQNKMAYEVVPGPKGDHVHVYVDGKEQAVLRELKGSYTFETMSPGSHDICIKVVNKGHTPIGVEKCIKVKVE